MAGTVGNTPADVADLPHEAHRYSLFAMLRLLEQLHDGRPRLGESRRVKDDALRLQQMPHLVFAPTDVHSLSGGEEVPAILEQYSFGVFGPNGSLPLHLTEHAFERRNQFNDRTFSDFINLFHHRLISLFYRAWANSDPAASYDRPDTDRFRTYLGALMGLGTPAAWGRDAVSDYAKFSRIGQFGPHARSAAGLEGALAGYFGLPISIRQFVGSWLDIPDADRCRLGDTRGLATLGVGATLGASTWQCQNKFEVIVGPLRITDFLNFMPGAAALEQLRDMVRLYTNDEWSCQIRLLLKVGDVPRAKLDGTSRLGWTAWLGGRTVTASDVVLRGNRVAQ
ncbi:MAG TPA: type VI secretion system baseplate subunit TssG [Steroidobacteraceae bacterium]